MSESQVKVYKRKRESYRLGQEAGYKLREPVKDLIKHEKQLFRFVEDYFHIQLDTVYRWLKSDDPALTQIGFLQKFSALVNDIEPIYIDWTELVEKIEP